MKKTMLLLLSVLFFNFNCNKENSECHHSIIFYNNFTDTIIFSLKYNNNDRCVMSKKEVAPGDSVLLQHRECWEKLFENANFEFSQEIFIIDIDSFYDNEVDCDSIFEKNKVIKYFNLRLNDLQNSDWKIYYP